MPGRAVLALFVDREQVEQQRAQSGVAKEFGDLAVARAHARAAAAVGEDDDARRLVGNLERAVEGDAVRGDPYFGHGAS